VGLSGADAGLLQADYEDEELGFVGRIMQVDATPLETLMAAGFLPVVAPLALLRDASGRSTGQLMNVNADTVAGELARALGAAALVFLTDVEGVRGADGLLVREVDEQETEALLTSGVISGGMIPKVEAGLRAGAAGANCLILDGREPHSLLAALDPAPPGTRILARSPAGGAG
jgi:acetylglutamate kinase